MRMWLWWWCTGLYAITTFFSGLHYQTDFTVKSLLVLSGKNKGAVSRELDFTTSDDISNTHTHTHEFELAPDRVLKMSPYWGPSCATLYETATLYFTVSDYFLESHPLICECVYEQWQLMESWLKRFTIEYTAWFFLEKTKWKPQTCVGNVYMSKGKRLLLTYISNKGSEKFYIQKNWVWLTTSVA
jgi:hypothetical protein